MVSQTSQPDETPKIADPWAASEPLKPPEFPQNWHLEPGAHPLISAAAAPEALLMQEGNPNAPQLPPSPQPSEPDATAILVEEELKLRGTAENLWNRIRAALALLFGSQQIESTRSDENES